MRHGPRLVLSFLIRKAIVISVIFSEKLQNRAIGLISEMYLLL